jgi:hypothetical protein
MTGEVLVLREAVDLLDVVHEAETPVAGVALRALPAPDVIDAIDLALGVGAALEVPVPVEPGEGDS